MLGRGPNGATNFANAPNGSNIGWNVAASLHPSGANVGIGDGSCRFVTDNVDLVMFGRMCSKADGEVTEGF